MFSGIVPFNKLEERLRKSMPVNRPNSFGIVPFKLLSSAVVVKVHQFKSYSDLANQQTKTGRTMQYLAERTKQKRDCRCILFSAGRSTCYSV
jgi:hypothetical protein